MEWVYDDGGRKAAGFKGSAGDCVCRAIAIAAEMPYKQVYDMINEYAKGERTGKKKRGVSSARNGVYKGTIRKVMAALGWEWVPTMLIGQGCKVHLTEEELPKGRLVVSLSRHNTAVIDGVIHDTYDPNDREDEFGFPAETDRCVYGYFRKA